MSELLLLRDLGFILAAATGVGLLARGLRVPPVLAYMTAGLLLGPATGLIRETATLERISHLGVALLLFLVGLELSLRKVRDLGRVALLVGGAQLAFTTLLGTGLAVLLGLRLLPAAILGLCLAFSSTVVGVKLLDQREELDTSHGRITVGILLIQDVGVAVVLTLLTGLAEPTGASAQALGWGLLRAFLGLAALLATAYMALRFILPPLFHWLSAWLEAFFIWSLSWCFVFILIARALGLSVEIGAFLAGLGLAQLPYNRELVRRVAPLADFFLAVFFVTLGIQLDAAAILGRWPAMLILSLFVLAVKPGILMALLPRFGYGERTSFLASVSLGQIGEFSFILAGLALAAGLVDRSLPSLVGGVGLVTIGASAALIQGGDRLRGWLRRHRALRPFRALAPEPPPEAGLSHHVIIVGMNTLGRRLVFAFVARGETVLAVDVDAAKLRGLPCATLQGSTDHLAVLQEARLAHARLLVSALRIEEANNLLAYRAHQAGIPASIHALDPALTRELLEYGAAHVMISKFDGIKRVAAALRDAGIIASP